MTLPASGNISILDLCTEFGATAPKSLTDFYKGGTWVPNIAANAAVPTSGSISLTNFYSARKLDVTMTAIDWADTSGTTLNLTSSAQTIAGIDTSVTLKVTFTTTNGGGLADYRINGITYIAITSGDTFSINLGDTLQFRTTRGARPDTITLTIRNESDGSALIDVYTANHT